MVDFPQYFYFCSMGIFDIFKKRNQAKEKRLCASCGMEHSDWPALGFMAPIHYDALNPSQRDAMAKLSSDFCVIRYPEQTDRFIRTTLTVPVLEACVGLDYGIWASLSEKSYSEYQAEYGNNVEGKTYFGTICNQIPGYDVSTLGLHVDVVTRGDGFRPCLAVHHVDHPLVHDLTHGISFEEAKRRIAKAVSQGA